MAKKRANGEGNIRKRKDGRWEGRYTAGYDEKTGKRITKSVLGKTQAEVKEKLARAITEAETLDTRRSDEYTLGTWLQTWYELYAKPHLRFSTAEYYRRGIELHITPRIGDIPLKKLTGRDLQWLYKDLQEHGRLREAQKGKQPGLSDSTIRGIHTMLHNALDRAVKERLIMRNPADDCVPPKIPKHEMKILPPEQIKSYLTAAEQRGVLPMFYLELISGLRKGELVVLQWTDLDIENKTISVSKQAGRNSAGEPDITRPKTENSIRKISIPQDAVELLIAEHQKHPNNPWMFPSPKTGEMYHPDSVVNIHKKLLKDAGLEHLRFHDLRHPYVKHTTKIFSLRLMDFQAQAYPDARRKTRGACQLHQGGQSRSPVRLLCNRKQLSCLPPQSKMSWILYAISMRLSGYTSTRSISSSASSVVSVSASKIALDASLRLSCRACSSCFCFACANTA
ncbi:tyrosine-type recombinase/integrase, partial [Gallintestinimicrobium sp.]|uniref:tyrosine-type recombinase/integrase n=1 Tax=Gallintestinimicrobium sp. TaxID=2981655 RepID=UPI003AB58396